MNPQKSTYEWFARWLNYPTAERRFALANDDHAGANLPSEVLLQLQDFERGMAVNSLEQMEELYTRTFDINPIANLEIGWHLYGEQYERGAFLVKMRQLLHEHFIEESTELPDHLTHVLLLLARLDTSEASEFSEKYTLPALSKILEAFRDDSNPYKNLLQALLRFLQQQHQENKPNFQQGAVTNE